MAMTQKEKKRWNRDNVKISSLANREANSLFKAQQKKKSVSITEKANLFNQISINSRGYEAKSRQQKKKSDNTTKHMDIVYPQAMEILLKEEIIMEILSRLPVQSLFRFKCVLKSWKALITDPYFKTKHLNHAKNDRNSQKLLIAKKCIDRDDMFNFYRSSLSSSFQVVEDENKLDCPSNYKAVNCVIYCCCDGLVLLSVTHERCKHLLLWNPSTGESIELPYPMAGLEDCVCGLAYDETSDEYKILAVSLKARFGVHIKVLPLKYGSWKYFLDGHPGMRIMYKCFGCCVDFLAFVHGSFHWIALSNCCTLYSLTISKYVVGEIPLLEQMWNTPDLEIDNHGVTLLKGMLCFYHSYVDFSCLCAKGIFKLWVMKDYGVKESWTISLSVEAGLFYVQPCMPIYMYPDGEVLIHSTRYDDNVAVFWTSRDSFEFLPRCRTLREGTVYTESLISPKLLI